MKAYITNGQGIDAIKLVEKPTPKILNDNDVKVEVKACSLNFRDIMIAKGIYSKNNVEIIALSDMAGVVKEVGANVKEFKPGDRVVNAPFKNWPAGRLRDCWAKTFIGGNGIDGVLAEEIVYPCESLVKIPDFLSFEEACTCTIAGLTAWSAIITHGKVLPGEWVLLHGTGGVSIFGAQLCAAMGIKTIMTTSSEEKAKLVKDKFRVTETVNYKQEDWAKKIKEITKEGVDVVVDTVGGDTLSQSLGICNYGARVAVIGVLGGTETHIRIRDLLSKQINMTGIFMESTQEFRHFMKAVETLKIKPAIDKTFSFNQAKEAYKHLESQKHVGKVVITL